MAANSSRGISSKKTCIELPTVSLTSFSPRKYSRIKVLVVLGGLYPVSSPLKSFRAGELAPTATTNKIVALELPAFDTDFGSPAVETHAIDSARDQVGSFLEGHLLEMEIEALPLLHLDIARSGATVDSSDPLLLQRCVDAHAADVHMQHVGIDTPLDDGARQIDAFGSEVLDKSLRDDAAAHVAAVRCDATEVARLEDIDVDVHPGSLGHLEKEIADKGAGRAGAHDRDPGAVVQTETLRTPTEVSLDPFIANSSLAEWLRRGL